MEEEIMEEENLNEENQDKAYEMKMDEERKSIRKERDEKNCRFFEYLFAQCGIKFEELEDYIEGLDDDGYFAASCAGLGVEIKSAQDLDNLREKLADNFDRQIKVIENMFEYAAMDFIAEDAISLSFSEEIVRSAFSRGFYPMAMKLTSSDIKRKAKSYLTVKYHDIKLIVKFENLHIPKNFKKWIKKDFSDYTMTFNKNFDLCVEKLLEAYPDTWLSEELVNVYKKIHENPDGNVSVDSVEIWHNGLLVAGEIGFTVKDAYASLSGFHLEDNIGNVQMAALGLYLKENGYKYWDLGMSLPYKYRFGAEDFDRDEQEALFETLGDKKLSFADKEIPLTDFL